MSTTTLQPAMPQLPSPSRVGQGTAVEQSRAVAEVHAAIVVAQQVPRNIDRAVGDMERSCRQKSLAEKAFYRFPRGKETISGPTVQLARELARCFGNMQYGLVELRRDDGYGQSEMQAWAWDVQTNTRSSTTFIVPHVRDSRNGSTTLTDQRDIYENNANNGARRLREMIFAILPGWYTEDAIAACYETLAADVGDGESRERVIASAVEGFAKLGVTSAHLVQKIGAPIAKWAPSDIAQLQVIYRSLVRGEISKEDEFPSAGGGAVTADDVVKRNSGESKGDGKPRGNGPPLVAAPQSPAAVRVVSSGGGRERPPARAATGQVGIIETHWKRLAGDEHDLAEQLAFTAKLAGVDEVGDFRELTQEQATAVQEALSKFRDWAGLVEHCYPAQGAPEGGDDAA